MTRKTTNNSRPTNRTMNVENKKRSTHTSQTKTNHTIVDHLRQQMPSSHSKKRRNENLQILLSQRSNSSTADTSELAPMDIKFKFNNEPVAERAQGTDTTADKDRDSAATENIDIIKKELDVTRVDTRIKIPPHANPEEKPVQVLQRFLKKLQSAMTPRPE